MNRKKAGIFAAAAAAVVVAGAGAAVATGALDDDATDKPIPHSALAQAKKAALAETGGGRVTETEVNDEESKYEVEVTLHNGSKVDVHLDDHFKVVGTESDGADDHGVDDGADDEGKGD
jgi:uncharacterized membrane protein YkoI